MLYNCTVLCIQVGGLDLNLLLSNTIVNIVIIYDAHFHIRIGGSVALLELALGILQMASNCMICIFSTPLILRKEQVRIEEQGIIVLIITRNIILIP